MYRLMVLPFSLLILLLITGNVSAQQATSVQTQMTEAERTTERLATLAKLWGTVKFFHPFMAYKEIDWDKALVETIPKVKAARSQQQYHQAIADMLNHLGDPVSKVESTAAASTNREKPSESRPLSNEPSSYFQIIDGNMVLKMGEINRLAITGNQEVTGKVFPAIFSQLNTVKGVVFDCRMHDLEKVSDFYWYRIINNYISSVIDKPITLGTSRYLTHNGYSPYLGSTSGGYQSAFITETPLSLNGRSKVSNRPIVVLFDDRTPDNVDLWSGLQWAGLATIVQVGNISKPLGIKIFQANFPEGLSVNIRITEFVHPNGSSLFEPDLRISNTTDPNNDSAIATAFTIIKDPTSLHRVASNQASANPPIHSLKDKPYSEMEIPSEEYRLLALFRYWNIINYFFPYKYLLDRPWETVLTDFIPRFQANQTPLDYQLTVAEMVARIQDSHGGVYPANALNEHLGGFAPAVALGWLEGQTVVTALMDEIAKAAGLNIGDVVLEIDDEPVVKRIERYAKITAASTPQSLRSQVHKFLLRGAQQNKVKLRIKGSDKQVREVTLERTMPWYQAVSQERTTPIYQVLPNGYGYIDLARLPRSDSDKAMDTVMNTPAIIFDMRGYPNGTAWTISPHLTTKRNVAAAHFHRPMVAANLLGDSDYSLGTKFVFIQPLPEPKGQTYQGKIVMLINEDAISQAEHTCLFFRSATEVKFIGTPTVGANGDVTNLVLPGNLIVYFTGQEVRHPDGRQLQRIGIQPDILVQPTIQGIKEGRDEILDAAVKYLDEIKQR
ncbi:MAG: S41 family peptidase [Acidobacteriota bacterium]